MKLKDYDSNILERTPKNKKYILMNRRNNLNLTLKYRNTYKQPNTVGDPNADWNRTQTQNLNQNMTKMNPNTSVFLPFSLSLKLKRKK